MEIINYVNLTVIEGILRFKNHSACGVNHSWYPCIHESTDSRVWDR